MLSEIIVLPGYARVPLKIIHVKCAGLPVRDPKSSRRIDVWNRRGRDCWCCGGIVRWTGRSCFATTMVVCKCARIRIRNCQSLLLAGGLRGSFYAYSTSMLTLTHTALTRLPDHRQRRREAMFSRLLDPVVATNQSDRPRY
jgi:hypothetical protein